MIADTQSPWKVCYACGTAQSVDQFRYRKKGNPARQGICRPCYNERMRCYRRARRSKTVGRFAAQLRRAGSLRRVEAVVAGMAARFGGVDALCSAWKAHIDAAVPGSPACLRTFLALARMAQLVEPVRQPPDLSQLTDEELEEELARLLSKALEDQG